MGRFQSTNGFGFAFNDHFLGSVKAFVTFTTYSSVNMANDTDSIQCIPEVGLNYVINNLYVVF